MLTHTPSLLLSPVRSLLPTSLRVPTLRSPCRVTPQISKDGITSVATAKAIVMASPSLFLAIYVKIQTQFGATLLQLARFEITDTCASVFDPFSNLTSARLTVRIWVCWCVDSPLCLLRIQSPSESWPLYGVLNIYCRQSESMFPGRSSLPAIQNSCPCAVGFLCAGRPCAPVASVHRSSCAPGLAHRVTFQLMCRRCASSNRLSPCMLEDQGRIGCGAIL